MRTQRTTRRVERHDGPGSRRRDREGDRPTAPPGAAARLQAAGNRAVGRLLQAKFEVSEPSDPFEQEADRVAESVTRSDERGTDASPSPVRIQRACAKCEEDEDRVLHAKREAGQPDAGAPKVDALVNEMEGGGEPLSAAARDLFEPRFDYDLGGVRVHADSRAAAAAGAVRARAFTVGRNVVFAAGQFRPDTDDGRKLLAHELTHVVQQNGRGASPGRARLSRSPRRGRCDSVVINLPGSITITGEHGPVQADITTNITPGEYTVRYDSARRTLFVDPWPTTEQILAISLNQRPQAEIDVYQGYLESLSRAPVGLRVAPSSAGGVGAATPESQVRFDVRILTPEDFTQLTGAPPSVLPESTLVSGAALPMAVGPSLPLATIPPVGASTIVPEQTIWPQTIGLPASLARFPSYPIPPNATGIIWTQIGHGHLSVFSNVSGEMTARGFRYDLWRNLFPERLGTGVPGSFQNDLAFTLLPNQTIVYRTGTPDAAAAFAERLRATEHNQTYRFPPRAGADVAVCGSNCINVPRAEIVEALGVPPEILTPEGPVDVTRAGRPQPGAPFETSQAGRGATVREYLGQNEAYFAERGLTVTRVPNMTIAARGGVGFVKVGGSIFMIYGAYRTGERLGAAYGTPEFPVVVGEEAGSWAGGILGTALGGAAGGAIFCAPTGPIDLVCVAGGFVGGLIVGGIGALGGSTLGRAIVEHADEIGARLIEAQETRDRACQSLPWYARGFCYAGSSSPYGPF